MALLHAASRCPLCDRTFAEGEPIFATSGVAFPPPDPAYPMCDAALHWDCYAKWPERPRFARGYFERSLASNPRWVVVLSDDDVSAAIGFDVIQVRRRALGSAAELRIRAVSSEKREEARARKRR